MNVAIIGAGYVGLVTGASLAHFGNLVQLYDVDADKIERLRRGQCPIYEPGLPELLARCGARISYHHVNDMGPDKLTGEVHGLVLADVVLLCVGTPEAADGSADLTALFVAAKSIKPHLSAAAVVAIKSTIPAGTCAAIDAILNEGNDELGVTVPVLACPEFLKEGDAVRDALRPDRVVIGANAGDARAADVIASLYAPFVRTPDQIIFTSRESAEIAKVACNAHLAARVTIMQEVARLCDAVPRADVDEIRRAVGADERIGSAFLYAGMGWGGSCFRKDLQSLNHQIAKHNLYNPPFIDAISEANETHRAWFRDMIRSALSKHGSVRVAVWGLSFKPETDDIRDSPALDLIASLRRAGHTVCAYDPAAVENARRALADAGAEFSFSAYSAAESAHALVLCTEWPEFRRPDFRHLRSIMKSPPALFDGRNVWPRAETEALGFTYMGVGR